MEETNRIKLRHFLVKVRGGLSQRKLSQMMGYKFNMVSRWENGLSDIPWKQFYRILELRNYSPESVLERTLPEVKNYDSSPELVGALMRNRKINDVANALGISRYKVSRWQSGKTEPRCLDILELFDHCMTEGRVQLEAFGEEGLGSQMQEHSTEPDSQVYVFPKLAITDNDTFEAIASLKGDSDVL